MSDKKTKYEEYLICKVRGHRPSGYQQPTNPPCDVCKYCGTAYHVEVKEILHESGVPQAECNGNKNENT